MGNMTTVTAETVPPTDNSNVDLFSVSLKRLVILSILTLGVYEFYWFYKNWQAIKKHDQSSLWAIGRAILSIFYSYSLFKRIFEISKKHDIKSKFPATLLAVVYIVVVVLGNVFIRFWNSDTNIIELLNAPRTVEIALIVLQYIFLFGTVVPLLFVQKVINAYVVKEFPNPKPKELFNSGELVMMIIWGAFWLAIGGVFIVGLVFKNIDLNKPMDNVTKENYIIGIVAGIKEVMPLPDTSDQWTTITDVTAEPSAIRYHYVISGLDSNLLTEEFLKRVLLADACADQGFVEILDEGINMEYSYTIAETDQKLLISVTSADCQIEQ
ncbi:MAG: hypothetical protein UT02_C0066G0006 [Parcubacteria group bacterium GW2011_GWC2_38_7]|nr:MAG: hypothetical protein UT02_C0066G0006 [Parcubacteria group bacterium GW2011_GWC2_38_7]